MTTAEEHLIDEGEACVAVRSGGGYRVRVDAGVCLSSSCDEVVDSICTVTIDMGAVIVDSDITIRRTSKRECTADCRSATAGCVIPPLEDGTYTLIYGGSIVGLALPLEAGTETCAGSVE